MQSFESDGVRIAYTDEGEGDPVLLIHGEIDGETPAAHSRRIFAALPEPKRRLVVVPGAGHGDALTADVWRQLDVWLKGEIP